MLHTGVTKYMEVPPPGLTVYYILHKLLQIHHLYLVYTTLYILFQEPDLRVPCEICSKLFHPMRIKVGINQSIVENS